MLPRDFSLDEISLFKGLSEKKSVSERTEFYHTWEAIKPKTALERSFRMIDVPFPF
jgi:hypothetical protein